MISHFANFAVSFRNLRLAQVKKIECQYLEKEKKVQS